jgi:hypothetical protein
MSFNGTGHDPPTELRHDNKLTRLKGSASHSALPAGGSPLVLVTVSNRPSNFPGQLARDAFHTKVRQVQAETFPNPGE